MIVTLNLIFWIFKDLRILIDLRVLRSLNVEAQLLAYIFYLIIKNILKNLKGNLHPLAIYTGL